MFSRVGRLFGSASRGGNYPYVTSRVRALKTHLLPQEEYPKLLARSVHEIARTLEEGQYSEEIHELASEYSGAQLIERATQEQMGREFQRILSWCKGEPHDLLGQYFERFTVANMKTLLRSAHTGASRDETRAALVPAGRIPETTWQAALDANNLAECMEALSETPYGRLIQGMEDERLPVIENALDREYYTSLVETVEPKDRANEAFLRFLRREIDVVNLKLVLRTKHAGVADYELVPGGKEVTEDLSNRIRMADWDEVPSILEDTSVGEGLTASLEAYSETRDLNILTGALEHRHLEAADQFSHLYPLSILPLTDYVLRKKLEVDRLRMIAFGKQTGLPREDIEELINL